MQPLNLGICWSPCLNTSGSFLTKFSEVWLKWMDVKVQFWPKYKHVLGPYNWRIHNGTHIWSQNALICCLWCQLWASPLFQTSWKEKQNQGVWRWATKKWGHPQLGCKTAKTNFSSTPYLLLFGKKNPPTVSSCLHVWWCNQGISGNLHHMWLVISLKTKRRLITFCIVLTPACYCLPNMRLILKKIFFEGHKNCKTNITFC